MASSLHGFNLEPLSAVANSFSVASERVVLIADRADFPEPYAFEQRIPAPGEPRRERGLDLLWARVVSITSGVVGCSRLRVFCGHDETFSDIRGRFEISPEVLQILRGYGEFFLSRVDESSVPKSLTCLPFQARSNIVIDDAEDVRNLSSEQRLFVGLDFGRSDVKAAVIDGTGKVLSTYVTRWWKPSDSEGGGRIYVDPQNLTSHENHLACLSLAALEAIAQTPDLDGRVVCGFGLSAAGCVQGGRLCGLPPTFGGVDAQRSSACLVRLEHAVLDLIRERARVSSSCATLLVNDGDASALFGAANLPDSESVGLFLSCGTGLAGGIVQAGRCCEGVLEVGKVIVGLRGSGDGGIVPKHDLMKVEGTAQGVAGTQRSFFNLLEGRGHARIDDKAEQRAKIVAMQKMELNAEVREIFECLGFWLAQFVIELLEYLPYKIHYVEAGGKLTDGPSGEVLLSRAGEILRGHGVRTVCRAEDSEFGQAIAMARSVSDAPAGARK